MRKHLFTYILLLITAVAVAQTRPARPAKSIVTIISSTRSQGVKINGEDVFKVYNGVFKQESTTLSADSTYFYKTRNSMDAFGNVHINQGDTLNVYSEKLYYNGNSHVALLTDNVRMIDRDATLTTNYLTYNTATRIGTYTGGGKLVNKENTLVSKNGYYFAFTRDAYFRYNVVLTTVDAVIKTDTLRYNSGTRISYFFGPTNIYGKDKDTLYTEKGMYNTITEQAFFSKNNMYNQGTKSLKGDSLFYDRLKGYGRAVKHVTFNDNEQKVTIKGDLGTYTRADEKAVVTENAYVIFVTEEKDTTQTDSAVKVPPAVKGKPAKNATAKKAPANTVPAKVTATGKPVATDKAELPPTDSLAVKPPPRIKRDTIYWGADTLETQIVMNRVLKDMQERMRLAGIKDTSVKALPPVKKPPLKVSTTKNLILMPPADIKMDMSFLRPDYFGAPKQPDTTAKKKPALAASTGKKDSLSKAAGGKTDSLAKKAPLKKAGPVVAPPVMKTDSVYMTRKFELSDTARIRILSAHHNAKIFKSDLQAKADSMFYSYSDSTMRCYVNPMIWTQGSQLSGDTILLQLKNKKLDNMDLFPSAFTVNIEGADSTNFNQVAGKRMRGFFAENKLQQLFVDGNAESIYFNRDTLKKTVTDLLRTISSRIRVNFKNNSATNVTWYTKVEKRIVPIEKTKDDDKILKGFLWKPKDRPASKESITSPAKKQVVKPGKGTAAKGKTATGKKLPSGAKPSVADSAGKKPPVIDSAAGKGRPMVDSAAVQPVTDTVIKKQVPTGKPLVLPKQTPVVDTLRKKSVKDTAVLKRKP